MARRCHGRSKKSWKLKTGRRQLRIEELGETWLRRRKSTKGCSAKWWWWWFPTFRMNFFPFSAVSSTSSSTMWAAWYDYRPKRRAVPTQQHIITSQKNRISSNTVVRASNVALRQKLIQIECRYEWQLWCYSPESIYCTGVKFTKCSWFLKDISQCNLNLASNSGRATSRSAVVCLCYWHVLNKCVLLHSHSGICTAGSRHLETLGPALNCQQNVTQFDWTHVLWQWVDRPTDCRS
jgi:hypothetical protein